MGKLDNKTLSVLSLLIIPGILLMPLFWNSHLVLLSILMCVIGGLSFGKLIGEDNKLRRSELWGSFLFHFFLKNYCS